MAAKTPMADVVNDLKKADELIDPFDAAAGAFIVWHRKASKAIGLKWVTWTSSSWPS